MGLGRESAGLSLIYSQMGTGAHGRRQVNWPLILARAGGCGEMDVPLWICNSALRGNNTSKTNRARGGGEEDEISEEIWGLSTLPRVMRIQYRSA